MNVENTSDASDTRVYIEKIDGNVIGVAAELIEGRIRANSKTSERTSFGCHSAIEPIKLWEHGESYPNGGSPRAWPASGTVV